MQTRISDPSRLADLEAYLRRMGCTTEAVAKDRLLVTIPASQRRDAAELELDLYLKLWELQVSTAKAERVG